MTWLDDCVVPDAQVFGLSPELAARIRAAMPYAVEGARRNAVALDLVLGVIWVESRFRPAIRSRVGAMGLMQVMPETFAFIARKTELPSSDPFDPATNIAAGTWLLGQLLRQFKGSVRLALAAYNAGAGNVKRHGGVPPFAETRAYVDAVPRAAENFRIARTQRCEGYSVERLAWRGGGGGGRRRGPQRPGQARPVAEPASADKGGLALVAVLVGLAWAGGMRL